MPRFLFGPVDDSTFADRFLKAPVDAGRWATFSALSSSWEQSVSSIPNGEVPEAILLWPSYQSIPKWVWSAPIPVIALAADANLIWHSYLHLLPLVDLVLTDEPSADRFRRAGLGPVRAANLFGLDRHFVAGVHEPEVQRDIDVLFIGNLNPMVQAARMPWLGRLGTLGSRRRVVIRGGVFGAEYRDLMRRAKLVFNFSIRGECNIRALEAAASGAVLLQEADNHEVESFLEPGREYAPYSVADFERVIERLLDDEGSRSTMAARARARVKSYAFDSLIERALDFGGPDWKAICHRAARRMNSPIEPSLGGRVWSRVASGGPHNDSTLSMDLLEAGEHHARAVLTASPAEAEPLLAQAAARGNRVSALGRAVALYDLGRVEAAIEHLREVMAELGTNPVLSHQELDSVPYPARFDHIRVGWERASFEHPDNPTDENAAKVALLTCRGASLLASWTGDIHAYEAAARAAPTIPAARAAFGCALARCGLFHEAVDHLAAAVDGNPFDRPAARALLQAYADIGDIAANRRFSTRLRSLAAAAPNHFPVEPWFGEVRPTGAELASLIVLCCNESEVTKLCMESVFLHTRRPYELVLVNNGSTDDTAAYLDSIATRPGPERVRVIHNQENRGYPAGVNQGLAEARGEYLVLLNNDVVVTPRWLDRLVRCAIHDWPRIGLAGAMTNYAPPPQLVEPKYSDLSGLDRFAESRATEFVGQAMDVLRLTGFCLLARRAVFESIGRLDEQFGLGFFDDDDLCLRARNAGFRLALPLDCYVHHFGSKTFRGLGIDTAQQLADNLSLYRNKWGAEEAAKYRTATTTLPPSIAVQSDVPQRVPAVPRGRPRVSLTMIVKNEEKNLPDCLASVRDLVDEAVVVDTGSSDRTREIARSFGAVVGEFPWIDHFAAARNAALDHATGDYAFWMDADDRIDEENRQNLRALFSGLSGGNDAYVVKCLCVPDKPGAGGTVVDHVRVFRHTPAHRWTYRVHEQILPALRATGADVRWSGVTVRHVGYVDAAVRRRKLDRDLRLLKLDEEEHPNDPFTLFNLGSVYNELGDHRAAAGALQKSLAGSHPRDSIVRKLYAMLTQCHARAGDRTHAIATCEEGRGHYPEDAELLFLAAGLAREGKDYPAAEDLYRRLIAGREGDHFASVDAGLRVVKGRHNLAVLLIETNRAAEAEGLWRAALTVDPHFVPAHAGLGDLYLRAKNRVGVLSQIAALCELGPDGEVEAAILESRRLGAEGDHGGAARALEDLLLRQPNSLGLRVALSHVRLADGSLPDVIEAALQAVLAIDPANPQARHNLQVLMRNTGRWVEGVINPSE